MRIIKILIIILIICLVAISGTWFYLTSKIAGELNKTYAGKEFAIKGIDKTSYFITFDQAVASGFPNKIAWKVNGWKEQSRAATIVYSSPLEFGYDLLSQRFFVNYDGDIIASYKPAKHDFGARLSIENYNITIDIPLSIGLLKTLKSIKDPVQIINHITDIKISTDKVEIFDLFDNEKFYDKEYERTKWSFVRTKNYENLEDILTHIPQEYKIDYVVKTKPNKAIMRRLPVSLFYGFSSLPAGFDLTLNAEVKTKSGSFDEFMKEVDIKANIDCKSSYIDLSNVDLLYKSKNYRKEFMLNTSSNITLKEGLFDRIFEKYALYAPALLKSPVGVHIDSQISDFIRNKEAFKLKDLENNPFDFSLKMNSYIGNNKRYLKIEDFNIQSDKSGIRLRHEMETNIGSNKEWFINGILHLTNYPTVIELSSGYIYRFGKFKFINDKARGLYASVNKIFLKGISDHPDSSSNDLSIEYNIDSKQMLRAKIGSAKLDNLSGLYSLTLYQKLFDMVGHGGDVLARMREILPELDGNEPILEKILPKISGIKRDKSDINNSVEK